LGGLVKECGERDEGAGQTILRLGEDDTSLVAAKLHPRSAGEDT